MKKKRIMLIFFIILLIIIVAIEAILFCRWLYYKPTKDNRVVKDTYVERYYKLVKITTREEAIVSEYTIITTKDDRVIDTRVVKEVDTSEKMESVYKELNDMGTIVYNIQNIDNVIKYNLSLDNGKFIDDVIKKYKNSPKFEEINIRKI